MMNYKTMGRILAQIFALEALFMLPPLVLSICDGAGAAVLGFGCTAGIVLAAGAALWLLCRRASAKFYARDGLVCVGLVWIFISLTGCLPFVISGEIPHFVDAFFETVSGFTTTGASILTNVEAMSRGMLYWRSFTHWLGGMGVLVFLLAVAPSGKGQGGFTLHLLRAESPGPIVGKLVPTMRQTATILYLIYILLTVLNIVFLLAGGMNWFDTLCIAFGTAGTGGFAVRADGLASYSPYLQTVCTVFMLLFGVNFNCYYAMMMRDTRSLMRNEEIRVYLGLFFGASLAIACNIQGMYRGFGAAFHHSAFQVASVMTTTGFATTDFNLWPGFSKMVLLLLMCVGACAGSTGGGLKCARLLLLAKSLRRSIRQLLHPQRVQTVRMDGQSIDEKIVRDTGIYLIAYAALMALSLLLISIDNFSVESNVSAVVSCLNNIGPGLDQIGPMSSYAAFSPFSKLVLIFDMLAGRLEIFPILILLSRRTWCGR